MNKKKQERKLIECLSCKKTKKHQARGLCSACYWTHSHLPFFESKWPLNVNVKYVDPLQKFKKVHPRVQSELDAISAGFPKRPDPVRKRGECQRCLENVFIFCRGLCGKCYHFESTSDNFNKDWPSKRQQKQSNKKDSSKLIECKKCEKKQKHCARGLCSKCYFTERAQGVMNPGEAKRPRSSNNPLPMKQMLSVSVGKRRICLPKISKI
ncbi:hypothetical protein M3Y97_01086400 [Aphelenchoides bicaudatus]|nr:hypothetical protein M3Y97_01086400 [Aphelenchoides bicaudatus]